MTYLDLLHILEDMNKDELMREVVIHTVNKDLEDKKETVTCWGNQPDGQFILSTITERQMRSKIREQGRVETRRKYPYLSIFPVGNDNSVDCQGGE